jgi:hypothetical protein
MKLRFKIKKGDKTMKNTEITRTREGGTKVTNPKNGQERINALREIVDNYQYGKIDGQMVDGFTASGIVQVYDALNEQNKNKYCQFTVGKMADIMWKLSKREG